MKPTIAVSMGDPGGIGPEVAVAAVSDARVRRACRPILVGDWYTLVRVGRALRVPVRLTRLADASKDVSGALEASVAASRRPPAPGSVPVVHTGKVRGSCLGKATGQGGRAGGRAVEIAVGLVAAGMAEGIATAPISKRSLALAGYGLVGHTELIARLTRTGSYAMMMAREDMRVVFATTHVPLGKVARLLTKAGLVDKIELARRYLGLYLGIRSPTIGVCGLNPHCGEGGALSQEEISVIAPAIRTARSRGIRVEGPYPGDSIFAAPRRFDAIVAMYHDQGMIPLKAEGFDRLVNITLGIPLLRTSPGHGTGFDIAGRGVASAKSMANAILVCAGIAKRLRHARRV